MEYSKHFFPIIVATLLVSLGANRASACTCVASGPAFTLPYGAPTDIPPDGLIFLQPAQVFVYDLRQESQLLGLELRRLSTGEVIPHTLFSTLRYAVIQPHEPLVPDEDYEVVHLIQDESPASVAIFHGVEESHVELSPPTIGRVYVNSFIAGIPLIGGFLDDFFLGSCRSPPAGGAVTVEGPGTFRVLTVDDDPPVPELPWQGSFASESLSQTVPLSSGGGSCGSGTGVPGVAPFARISFRIGFFDATGRFSGWSEPGLAQFPPPGCSCSAGHTSGSPTPLFGFIGLLFVLRGVRRPIENSR